MDPRGGWFYRIGLTVAICLFVVSLFAIGRVAWALSHNAVWVNYRGSVLSHSQMYLALGLSVLTAVGSLGFVALLRRAARSGRR